MGIVNAAPDSFSEPPGSRDPERLVELGLELARDGAAILEVGGESGRTDRAAVSEEEEAARIVPVIQGLSEQGMIVSAETWRTGPARAALEAGAAMINDPSGLAEPALAELCAQSGAALVITHTRTAPKTKRFPGYDDVVRDVIDFLAERVALARELRVEEEQIVLDPGIDLAKTPAESVEVLRRLDELHVLGRPLLLAVSRKDFVGAVCGRPPRGRGAGTLAALEPALDAPGAIVRVHDVAAASDFLAVRRALRGQADAPSAPLAEHLRREETAP